MAFDADSVKIGRRGLLAGGGALGLTGVLAACGTDDGDDADGGSGGSWSFTDDSGATVELDAVPTKIVAFTGLAAAIHDFGITPTGVFGPTVNEDGSATTQAGNLPVGDIEIIGNSWGEFDLEAYVTLEPQIIATHFFRDPSSLWYVPEERADEITDLAEPVLLAADDGESHLGDVIERHAAFAESLGADLESEENLAAKERYDAAVAALQEAVADNPVTVLACSAAADFFWVSNPESYPDLRLFTSLGLEVIVPENPDVEGGSYFENLSWENVDTYQADVLLLDSREVAIQPDALAEFPTWNALPAVQEGQIVGWNSEPTFSYAGSAPHIEALAEAISNAKKLI
ncbi:ABC transporter substrate-binding protein [Glycomyces sp. NRRL B-16210]|uniref:ABC transporter substrate-binding protein n=1 Tax=Glycomyces sp. NRRL B-16210 TaxID=1463821 RepID=UPI0004C170C6|nr:ABC transporter substrate-binding protein [Glycomyces sp. NRRL B-16210]